MKLVLDEIVRLRAAGAPFALHVPTTSLFELDEETHEALAALQGMDVAPREDLAAAVARLPGLDAGRAGEIVSDLVRAGLLVDQRRRSLPVCDPLPAGEGIRNLTLHVAHDCNMACRYCYADHGLYFGAAARMSPEQAEAWVDWLFSQADPGCRELGLSFFGGEPLLAFPSVRRAALRARRLGEERGIGVRLGITTNGTLVTPRIADFLHAVGAVVTVSLDAARDANDRQRPLASGRGSYDRVLRRVRPLLDKGRVVARATVTRQSLDVVETVECLLAEGFAEVGCSPVDAGDPCWDLAPADYAVLLEGFGVLTRRFVDAAASGRRYGFSNASALVRAFHAGHNKAWPCGAGIGAAAAVPDGRIFLCHRFAGTDAFALGSLALGVDQPKRRAMVERLSVGKRSDCATCWARWICSGGCHHVNFLFGGDPARTYRTHCDWLRSWYHMALAAYAEIQKRNPRFIQEFIDPGWVCPSS